MNEKVIVVIFVEIITDKKKINTQSCFNKTKLSK